MNTPQVHTHASDTKMYVVWPKNTRSTEKIHCFDYGRNNGVKQTETFHSLILRSLLSSHHAAFTTSTRVCARRGGTIKGEVTRATLPPPFKNNQKKNS